MLLDLHTDPRGRIFIDPAEWADMDAWHATAAELRAEAPVLRVEAAGYEPFWALTRHADVFEVSRHHERWHNTQRSQLMDDFTWDRDRHDFIDTLRKAGIQTLVVTNQSTGLMEDLHGYAAEGCTMLGLCTITKKDTRWGEEKEEQIMGIRFQLS